MSAFCQHIQDEIIRFKTSPGFGILATKPIVDYRPSEVNAETCLYDL